MKKIIGIIAVIIIIIVAISAVKNNEQRKKTTEQINDIQRTAQTQESNVLSDGSYDINTNDSQLRWTGRTALKSHYGTIDFTEGEIDINNGNIQGEMTLDMNTIASEAGDGLDSHLKNEDFFDIVNYPESNIVINSFENGNLNIDLTIKEITNTIQVPVLVSQESETVTINGITEIDRTLWGIEYSSGSVFNDLGDRAINDNLEIEFDLVGVKK